MQQGKERICNNVDIPYLMPGDIVRVLNDISLVHELQQEGPGWIDDMALCLGQLGRVTKRSSIGSVQVSVNGKRWIFHSKCLEPAPEFNTPNNADEEEVDLNSRLQMLAIVSDEGSSPEGIPYAAAAGDAATLRQQLDKHPDEINVKVKGKTALHVAGAEGYIDCFKLLLRRGADTEMMDDAGEKVLHICAFANQVEAVRVLLEHGVDVNSRNVQDCTALMIAAGVGHRKIVRLLTDHQQTDLHAQEPNGNTALHHAVNAHRSKTVSVLLEGGADPSRVNFGCSTPLHTAAGLGMLHAVERMVAHCPDLINTQKMENGYTPLHVAVANGRRAVVEFLSQQPSSNLDLRTAEESLTPLHIAVHEGYSAMVEHLVGCGADINAITSDRGNTALHLVISRKNMQPLSFLSPELEQVKAQLMSDHGGFSFEPYVVVACFLVREGGDIYMKNYQGISPIQLAPPDIGNVIAGFFRGLRSFHGSLRGHRLVEFSPSLPQTSRSKPSSSVKSRTPPPSTEKRTRKSTPTTPATSTSRAPAPATGKVSSSTAPQLTPPPPSTPKKSPPRYPQASPPPSASRTPPPLPSPTANQDITGEKNKGLDKDMPKEVGRKPKLQEQRNDAGIPLKEVPGLASTLLPGKDDEESDEGIELVPAVAKIMDYKYSGMLQTDHQALKGGCFLCENSADAQLNPCGHTGMCFKCAHFAKRCPTCKAQIMSVSSS